MSCSVSVIIPVYNCVQYLSCCINSILNQSFRDFEVLLIDDGSTDGSGSLCDEFAMKDERIRVVHKENGGVSSARNVGLDNAIGEYVVFIDADDYINELHLEHLMGFGSDFVITGVHLFQSKDEVRVPSRCVSFKIEELSSFWNTPPSMNYLYCYPWAKRFRMSIIQKEGIRFNEALFFSEDMCFNMQYMSFANSFTELPFDDYMYRLESINRDEKYRMSAEQLILHYEFLDTCFQQLYSRIIPNSLSFVRDNTNYRLLRKFYTYLMQVNTVTQFMKNISLFRNKEWSTYLLSLLSGRKEKRVMNEAVRFPFLTYLIEVRLVRLIHHFKSL